jgi:hypothetical protein
MVSAAVEAIALQNMSTAFQQDTSIAQEACGMPRSFPGHSQM